VIRDALNRGVDLRVYSKQVDTELHAMEALSIADYIRESDSIAGLFGHITSCEGVLSEMQSLLQTFQDKLGGISDEIRSLQESSMALSVKKQNRKNLAGKVKAVLSKIDVSEGLISRICDAPIDAEWLRDLRALSEKVEFISGVYRDREARAALATHAPGLAQPALPASEPTVAYALDSLAELTVNPVDTPAGRDAVPQIELLRKKAVARVRDFLLRSMEIAQNARISLDRIILDPGIGFGKTPEQNMILLHEIETIAALGCPVLIGASRKRIIGSVTGRTHPSERLAGSLAFHTLAAQVGAHLVRVHDVGEHVDAMKMVAAFKSTKQARA
jgi:dihydropteroate synthase